jgi:hypothetical protein
MIRLPFVGVAARGARLRARLASSAGRNSGASAASPALWSNSGVSALQMVYQEISTQAATRATMASSPVMLSPISRVAGSSASAVSVVTRRAAAPFPTLEMPSIARNIQARRFSSQPSSEQGGRQSASSTQSSASSAAAKARDAAAAAAPAPVPASAGDGAPAHTEAVIPVSRSILNTKPAPTHWLHSCFIELAPEIV